MHVTLFVCMAFLQGCFCHSGECCVATPFARVALTLFRKNVLLGSWSRGSRKETVNNAEEGSCAMLSGFCLHFTFRHPELWISEEYSW